MELVSSSFFFFPPLHALWEWDLAGFVLLESVLCSPMPRLVGRMRPSRAALFRPSRLLLEPPSSSPFLSLARVLTSFTSLYPQTERTLTPLSPPKKLERPELPRTSSSSRPTFETPTEPTPTPDPLPPPPPPPPSPYRDSPPLLPPPPLEFPSRSRREAESTELEDESRRRGRKSSRGGRCWERSRQVAWGSSITSSRMSPRSRG